MTSININKEKFGQLIHKEKPVLVDFCTLVWLLP